MKVSLIAYTTIVGWGAMRDAGWVDYVQDSPYDDLSDADALGEFAGRACYQSWERPNPATATNEAYLGHILEVDHGSVLEHASATFYVTGVSRSLTHELIRHRHMSFSELSQRFVNMDDAKIVIPPAVDEHDRKQGNEGLWGAKAVGEAMTTAAASYANLADMLQAEGFTRKQVREAARAVLPSATETKIVVTGNMRAWRYVIAKRIAPEADAEMQLFAREVLRQLKEIAPHTFQDM